MAEEPEVAEEFGPNAWLVDELYEQYRSDPNSVSASWQDFFADYRRDDVGGAPPQNGGPTASFPVERATTAEAAAPPAAASPTASPPAAAPKAPAQPQAAKA